MDDYVEWLDRLWTRRLRPPRQPRPELSIGILLWPGFPMMSLGGIIEPLRHAADYADRSRPLYCRWSIMGDATVASCGIRVSADSGYVNPHEFDYVAVIGGLLPQLDQGAARHREYLRVAAAAGVPLIGACTGVFVLAQEGLLSGVKVCVHPFHQREFRMAFPRIPITTRQDFLEQGQRITVPGGVSILSLMAELIRRHCGPDRAAKAVHQLSLTERKGMGAFERARAAELRPVDDPRVQRAVVLIESLQGTGIAPKQVADTVALSLRQLTRLFRDALGMTPKHYILQTRLRHARFLVENSAMPMTAIALETGFADCAHFSSSFRSRFGASPTRVRDGSASVHG